MQKASLLIMLSLMPLWMSFRGCSGKMPYSIDEKAKIKNLMDKVKTENDPTEIIDYLNDNPDNMIQYIDEYLYEALKKVGGFYYTGETGDVPNKTVKDPINSGTVSRVGKKVNVAVDDSSKIIAKQVVEYELKDYCYEDGLCITGKFNGRKLKSWYEDLEKDCSANTTDPSEKAKINKQFFMRIKESGLDSSTGLPLNYSSDKEDICDIIWVHKTKPISIYIKNTTTDESSGATDPESMKEKNALFITSEDIAQGTPQKTYKEKYNLDNDKNYIALLEIRGIYYDKTHKALPGMIDFSLHYKNGIKNNAVVKVQDIASFSESQKLKIFNFEDVASDAIPTR